MCVKFIIIVIRTRQEFNIAIVLLSFCLEKCHLRDFAELFILVSGKDKIFRG